MKRTGILVGGAMLSLAFAAAPAAAQGSGSPPFGVWGGPSVIASGGPTAASAPGLAAILGQGPVGCYFTKVRVDNRWVRAQVCDWNPGFGAP